MRFRLGDAETLPRRLQRGRHLVKAVTKEGTLRAWRVEGGRVLDFSLFILEFCGFAFIHF